MVDRDPIELLKEGMKKERENIITRGRILVEFLDLELEINGLLAEYYSLPSRRVSFFSNFLSTSNIPFKTKVSILRKITLERSLKKYKKTCKKLLRLNELRNKVAHSPSVRFGDSIFNYKSMDQESIHEIESEFLSLYGSLHSEIGDLFQDLRKLNEPKLVRSSR